jgi:hypothetical protein
MAQQFSASVYGANGNDLNSFQGITKSFPSQGVSIQALNPVKSYSGVTCVTVISLLPTGLNQVAQQFYSPTATATVISAANA